MWFLVFVCCYCWCYEEEEGGGGGGGGGDDNDNLHHKDCSGKEQRQNKAENFMTSSLKAVSIKCNKLSPSRVTCY